MGEIIARVRFVNGDEQITNLKDIQAGNDGSSSALALYRGKWWPVYTVVEWGNVWHEQKDGLHYDTSYFDDDGEHQ
jgi:hypothetical protein